VSNANINKDANSDWGIMECLEWVKEQASGWQEARGMRKV
jgi:hypothetical protein